MESFLKEYNLTYHSLFDVSEGSRPVVIAGSFDDESNVYSDSLSQKSYQFNHLTNEMVSEVEYVDQPAHSDPVEALRQSLIPEIRKYISTKFCKRSGA